MLPTTPPRLTVALFCAMGTFALGCGNGLFDRGNVRADAGQTDDTGIEAPPVLDATWPLGPDAGTDVATDTASDLGTDGRADAGPDSCGITKIVDESGAEMSLDQATLIIGPGTFRDPTPVCLRELPTIAHTGAYGPVFEVSVPSSGLFHQDAKLTLQVPSIGANQANLVLGALDPSRSAPDQQWYPAQYSILSPDQTSITGSVTGLNTASVYRYAVVLQCSLTAQCRSGEACNSQVCQQCPTSSVCAP